MFRIHDILVWIRIRGSIPLTNGSGSCYFRHCPTRCQQKTNFLTQFFLLVRYSLKVHLHYFSKIKSQKGSQNSWIQDFFLLFLHDDRRIRSIPLTSGSEPGRPKNMWIRIRIRNTAYWRLLQYFLNIILPYCLWMPYSTLPVPFRAAG